MKSSCFAAIVAATAMATMAMAQSLTTAPPDNGSGGVFMNLTNVRGPVSITQFDVAYTGTVGDPVDVEVYTRPGSYVGFESDPSSWTLNQTVSGVKMGTATLSPLQLTAPILIDGQTAVYLHAVGPSTGGIRYTGTAASPPQTTWANDDLELFSDVARTGLAPFAGTLFTPRTFAGTIHYQAPVDYFIYFEGIVGESSHPGIRVGDSFASIGAIDRTLPDLDPDPLFGVYETRDARSCWKHPFPLWCGVCQALQIWVDVGLFEVVHGCEGQGLPFAPGTRVLTTFRFVPGALHDDTLLGVPWSSDFLDPTRPSTFEIRDARGTALVSGTIHTLRELTCYADCDSSGELDFFDFLCFQNAFASGDPYADCDESGSLDFFDFLCFQNAFAAGCP